MSHFARAWLAATLLLVLSASAANAQNATVRGEVHDVSGPLDHVTVHLVNIERRSETERAFVSSGGPIPKASGPPKCAAALTEVDQGRSGVCRGARGTRHGRVPVRPA